MLPLNWLFAFIALLVVLLTGCAQQPPPPAVASPTTVVPPTPTSLSVKLSSQSDDELPLPLFENATEPTRLAYGQYVVSRRTKQFRDKDMTRSVELSYAILTRLGKQVLKFDAVNHPFGNETQFGFSRLLKGQAEQLVVEQSSHRWERSWVVQLISSPKFIYDNAWYEVGDNLVAKDIDRDGTYELIQRHQQFWFYEFSDPKHSNLPTRFYNTNSPFTQIVFAYNPKSGKYEPANPHFKAYVLGELTALEESIESLWQSQANDMDLLGKVFERTLTLLFVREEKRAWQSFRERCRWDDCQAIERKFKASLQADPVYRYFARHK